ncbi:hypothetical protein B8A44_02385 [Dolosigranulum pigrum]|jgi:hypothetical protein|uniref:ABC transporter permease n=2 Tax=Dolosigranulum TaxID=29393 RepID=A0A328K676_9LACT|nr:ABC transporter permease [Dolosigranulum pigrum]QTJ42299.1 hypothetical protein FE326_09335 [Dolosigranulum pigrum]QTJ45108.1 hypothetical protein FE328_06050 [Dolosigranulum pigrum]QTJ50808.1 hypothetical protein FE331_09485 [Dolosigranulum pigrum]RAN52858.1 hypothetical protein B8A31_03550 [Dolosigranulum pigrum]RAN63677.1 hypothetical protein B8A45_07975 [Dolosigranulum pigrum]
MSKILKFEWYKTKSRKIIPKVSAVFVVWGVLFSIFIKFNPDFMSYETAFKHSFLLNYLLTFAMVWLAATKFGEEFEHRTIIPLVTIVSRRQKIFWAKLIEIIINLLLLQVVIQVLSMGLNYLVLNQSLDFNAVKLSMFFSLGSMLSTAMIITLSIMMVSLFKKSMWGLIAGVVVFIGYNVGNGMNFSIIAKYPWTKYSIINVINLQNQIVDLTYEEMTMLSVNSLIWINVAYLVIFCGIGYVVFRNIEI